MASDFLCLSQILKSKGFQEDGYFVGQLNPQDLKVFQTSVFEHFCAKMSNECNGFSSFEELKFYHKFSPANHDEIWGKTNRIFSRGCFERIRKTTILESFFSSFEGLDISSEEFGKYPEIYFRLVRPSPFMDIGPMHVDKWFWDLSESVPEISFKRVKFWCSLLGEDANTGFQLVKKSHKMKFQYGQEIRHGKPKPVFNINDYDVQVEALEGGEGTFIIFDDELLHGGYQLNSLTRVSCEFTLLVPIDDA